MLCLFRYLILGIISPSTSIPLTLNFEILNLWRLVYSCTYYFCTLKFSERDSKNCVLKTWFHGFHYTKQANVLECSLRSLQIGCTVHSKTCQVYLNDMWVFKYKFLEREMKCCWEGGQNTKFCSRSLKAWHSPAKMSSSLSQSHCDLSWQQFQSPDIFEPWASEWLRRRTQHIYTIKKWIFI